MRKLLYTIAITAAVATASSPIGMGAIRSVKASLDSTHLLMGNVTPLHIQVTTDDNSDGNLMIAGDTLSSMIEYRAINYKGATDIAGGLKRHDYEVTIQAFDSGPQVIPPIPYVSNSDTAYSDTLMLMVTVPAGIDTVHTITDNIDVLDAKDAKWTDNLPEPINKLLDYWPWILAGLVIIAGGIVAFIMLRRRHKESDADVYIPPYQWAMMQLNDLREAKIFGEGNEREFYTRLTEILREYLDRRYGINAMEMTSSQIIEQLRHHETKLPAEPLIKRILATADFVKFAKMRPATDDNIRSFNDAVQFVEDTKPAPEPDADDHAGQPTNDNPTQQPQVQK